jgi:DNA-binding transcriptional LysR family regulator
VSRQLFAFQFIVCAAPAYMIQHGWPKTLEDLWQHRCSGFRHPGTGRLFPWEFLIGNEIVFRDIPAVFCTNESDAEYHAVLQGMAIGLLGSISANEDLRTGRLVPLLCEHASQRMGLHIYYPQRTDMPRRVRNFIDYAVIRLNNCPEYIFSSEELAALHKQGIASLSQADEQ